MSTTYTATATTLGPAGAVQITSPADGDALTAASSNVGAQKLADISKELVNRALFKNVASGSGGDSISGQVKVASGGEIKALSGSTVTTDSGSALAINGTTTISSSNVPTYSAAITKHVIVLPHDFSPKENTGADYWIQYGDVGGVAYEAWFNHATVTYRLTSRVRLPAGAIVTGVSFGFQSTNAHNAASFAAKEAYIASPSTPDAYTETVFKSQTLALTTGANPVWIAMTSVSNVTISDDSSFYIQTTVESDAAAQSVVFHGARVTYTYQDISPTQ